VLVLGPENDAYTNKSFENDLSAGCRLQKLDDPDARGSLFPPGVALGPCIADRSLCYMNHDGGWVHATGGIAQGMKNVARLGGKVIPGKQVQTLLRKDGKTSGVECTDGSIFEADVVVIATGSWTGSVFADLKLEGKFTATGCIILFLRDYFLEDLVVFFDMLVFVVGRVWP
jgi:sarcosine oxidase / L-pipecolate oxidase